MEHIEDDQQKVKRPSTPDEPNENAPFGHQGYEESENPIGEGPQIEEETLQAQDEDEPYEGRFLGAEGILMDDIILDDEPIDQDEDELPTPGMSLPCESKVDGNLFVQRLRNFVQNPNIWRIIKGLLVVVIAIKLFNSYEIIEPYVPKIFGSKLE